MQQQLNERQRAAILHLGTPLLVLAGAGSGKTRVITHKIAHLIQKAYFLPHEIAAITFTNKAAREMQQRCSSLLPASANKHLSINTFHSLGLQILRQEAKLLNYRPGFSILDAADCSKIIGDILSHADKATIRAIQWQISHWKNNLKTPEQAMESASVDHTLAAARVFQRYQTTLKTYQAVDFDDLITLPTQLLQKHPETLEKWQRKLRYLLIDEYQDTSICQYHFIKLLIAHNSQLTAVGDDDQAIYAWRGASLENIQHLIDDFPNLTVIKLEQNYRSTVRILRAANQVISNNTKLFDKKLWSDLGTGDQIQIYAMRDDYHEAESTAMRLSAHKFERRTQFSDYAILYRSNHQSRLLEEQLRIQKIPYTLSGGQSFFERTEIKDITSYLRLVTNEDDDHAFIRAATTPKKGIGNTTLAQLGAYAAAHHLSLFAAAYSEACQKTLAAKQLHDLLTFCQFIHTLQYRSTRQPLGEWMHDLLQGIQYEHYLYDHEDPNNAEKKWKNVQDFQAWLTHKGTEDEKNILELTQLIALINMLDNQNENQNAVKLSTIHAAKGLEFPHVFLIGVEEGILPHRESLEENMLEEERRLMYVAITRAQRSLHISWCKKRRRSSESTGCEPSRFLAELPDEDIRHWGQEKQDPATSKQHGKEHMDRIRNMFKKT